MSLLLFQIPFGKKYEKLATYSCLYSHSLINSFKMRKKHENMRLLLKLNLIIKKEKPYG